MEAVDIYQASPCKIDIGSPDCLEKVMACYERQKLPL